MWSALRQIYGFPGLPRNSGSVTTFGLSLVPYVPCVPNHNPSPLTVYTVVVNLASARWQPGYPIELEL